MYMTVMAKRYSIAEARSHLPSLVDEAESGQEIELTRRGKPVAVLLSLREVERLRGERAGFGDAYRRFLKTYRPSEDGLDEEEIASTRDRSAGRKVAL
jgi:prevent-host-death family protein